MSHIQDASTGIEMDWRRVVTLGKASRMNKNMGRNEMNSHVSLSFPSHPTKAACVLMEGEGGGLNLLRFLWNAKFGWPDE